MTGRLADELAERLRPLVVDRCPLDDDVPAADARGTTWCEPVLTIEVAYHSRTSAGRLRHPVLRGVRDDAPADPWRTP